MHRIVRGILPIGVGIIAGFLSGNSVAVTFNIPPDANNTPYTLTNGQTGTINAGNSLLVAGATALTINQNGAGAIIVNNSGTIQATTVGQKTILGNAGGGIGAITINNNGTTTNSANNATATTIDLQAITSTGAITLNNSAGGIIIGKTILPNAVASTFNINGGVIQGETSGNANFSVVSVNANYSTHATSGHFTNLQTLTVTNAGTIFQMNTNGGANTMAFFAPNANTTTIINGTSSLTVTDADPAALENSGTIIVNGATTIDVTAGGATNLAGSQLTLNNATARLSGNLVNNAALLINNGRITGNITTTNAASTITVASPAFKTEGTISGPAAYTMTINAGAGITINNAISQFGTYNNNGTSTIAAGGSIAGAITGSGLNTSILNINTNYGSFGNIANVYTINVNGVGATTFTVNNPVTGFNSLNATGTVTVNAGNLTGTNIVLNGGILNINTPNSVTAAIQGNNVAGFPQININSNYTTTGNITGVSDINVALGTVFTIVNPIAYGVFTNSGTTNINAGGSISGAIAAGGVNSIINLNTSLTTAGNIAAQTVNVNTGTLTVSSAANGITATNALNINPGASAVFNSGGNVVTGNLVNSGTVSIPATARGTTTNVTNNVTLQPAGVLNIPILSNNSFGQLAIGGAGTSNGTINITLPQGGAQITNGIAFNLVNVTGAATGAPTVNLPTQTALLSFAVNNAAAPNILQVVSTRTSLGSLFPNMPELIPLANTLDNIRTNPTTAQLAILQQLDAAPDVAALQNELIQLLPDSGNGGSTIATFQLAELPITKFIQRIDASRAASADRLISGYAAGDMTDGRGSSGPILFGHMARQKDTQGIPGYTAYTGGFGFAGDVPISTGVKLGGGIVYGNSGVTVDDNTHNVTSINNFTGIGYTSMECLPFFGDLMLGLGTNNYGTRRNILITSQTARGKFNGYQYMTHGRFGIAIPITQTIEVAPMGSVQYMRVYQKEYTEFGAPGSNLVVSGRKASISTLGFGLRVADIGMPDEYYPEVHAMYLYNLQNPNLLVTARFLDGGPSFFTQQALPARNGVNAGGSVTAVFKPGMLFIAGYDLEARKNYVAHAISLKFRWLF